MPILILAAFIGVPLIEIAVFIQVGGLIGLWPTLALIVLTALIGSWQLRSQGLATLARGRSQLDQGQLPTRELFDGLCLLFAGALLLTPGFVTDAVGLLLFLPAFRDLLRGWFSRFIETHGETRVWVDGVEVDPKGRGTVIDGEFEEVGSEKEDPPETPDDRRIGGQGQ